MSGQDRVHKRITEAVSPLGYARTKCNRLVKSEGRDRTSFQWIDVTCPNCLAKDSKPGRGVGRREAKERRESSEWVTVHRGRD